MSGFRWPAADEAPRFPRVKTSGTQGKSDKTIYTTSNNQSYGVRATTIESQNAFAPTPFQVTNE